MVLGHLKSGQDCNFPKLVGGARGALKGAGGRPPPWDLKNTIFSGVLLLNYVICNFEVCFFYKLFAMWED